MTPERARELLPIIQAYAEGKTIQVRHKDIVPEWVSLTTCAFDEGWEYRIKPEPKVIYVNEYEEGRRFFETKLEALDGPNSCGDGAILRKAVKYIEASD